MSLVVTAVAFTKCIDSLNVHKIALYGIWSVYTYVILMYLILRILNIPDKYIFVFCSWILKGKGVLEII